MKKLVWIISVFMLFQSCKKDIETSVVNQSLKEEALAFVKASLSETEWQELSLLDVQVLKNQEKELAVKIFSKEDRNSFLIVTKNDLVILF